MDQTTRRYLAIALSICIHAAILVLVARFTMDLTSPEGTVADGTLEVEMMPQGSQTSTANVAPVAVPSENPTPVNEPPPAAAAVLPQKTVPSQEAKAAPLAAAVPVQESQATTESQLVEESPVVTAGNESESPTTTTLQESEGFGVAAATVPDTESNAKSPTDGMAENQAAAAAPTAGPAAATDTAAAREGAVANQNYGVPTGATDARTLAAMPGNRRPEYPLMARFRRIQGRTVAQFKVSGDGTVTNPTIYSSQNEAFNKPVLEAIRTWKFKGPVQPGDYFWTFDFRLSGQEKEAGGQLRR